SPVMMTWNSCTTGDPTLCRQRRRALSGVTSPSTLRHAGTGIELDFGPMHDRPTPHWGVRGRSAMSAMIHALRAKGWALIMAIVVAAGEGVVLIEVTAGRTRPRPQKERRPPAVRSRRSAGRI